MEACAYCGTDVPASALLRYKSTAACARCKPFVVQLVKEGSLLPGQESPAGFWIRAGARILDSLLAFTLISPLIAPLQSVTTPAIAGGPGPLAFAAICGTSLLQIAIAAMYDIAFLALFQATPGKLLCRLKVTVADGGRITWKRAVGRYFAYMLSSFTLGIGFAIAAFDEQKRALHDHVCNTRVVRIA